MAFLMHFGGTLKEGKARELQEWLAANEKEYANAHPPGSKYLGTYFSIYTSEKQGGSVHTFIEAESYGSQDTMAELGKGDNLYARLTNELIGFFDQQSQNWTQALYKRVVDATVYGED